jgi:hypothetical protein
MRGFFFWRNAVAKFSPAFNWAEFINGIPATGAKVFTYAAGSSTKQNTYTDEGGLTANPNPIILDARGEPPNDIWLTEGQSYKFVFTSSTDTDPPTSPIRTIDDVTGVNDTGTTTSQWVDSGVTPTYVNATQFTLPGDQTTEFQVNRRIKATVTAGTVYGYISASVFGALTTVTVVLDSGTLDSGLSAVQLGLITPTNTSLFLMQTGNLADGLLSADAAGRAKMADEYVTNAKIAFDGGAFGFRNKIRNGDFRVNQTGLTYTSTSLRANNDDAYTLDGWYILSDGNDTIDVSQDTTTIPTNGYAAIALDVETTNRKFGIAQIIEARDCVDLIGNTVTLSFKAKVSATTNLDNVKCAIVAWSGTADSVTSDIVSAWNVEGTNPTLIANATYENTPANLNLTTSYAEYSVTAAIDTASTKNIIVFIWSDVTTTSAGEFLYITDVQLEKGETVTPFERKTYDVELAWAERFLPIIKYDGGNVPLGAGTVATANSVRLVIDFTQSTRIAVTGVLVSAAADFEVNNGAARACNSATFVFGGKNAAIMNLGFVTALTANTGAYGYGNASTALLVFTGAEL